MFASSAQALDAGMSAAGGMLIQNGEKPVPGYTVGVELPIVTKADSSYTVYTITDYTYIDRIAQDATINELSIIRSMFMYERNVYKSLVLGLGTGIWKVINSNGEDMEHVALRLKIGVKFFGIETFLAQEVVRINGKNDMYYSTVNLNLFK